MEQSQITIDVKLDADKIPQQIVWNASAGNPKEAQPAKAMMLAFWDGQEKSALRIDLWTKDMMVDEMGDFFYQTLMTMADSYNRSTHQTELVNDLKQFAADFYKKSRDILDKKQ
jgi:gliding motility-associated protein GldC